MKTLVALPSYNEAENITQLVEKILSLSENYHIVVIDDNSPDQTFEILNAFIVNLPSHDQQRVHAIKRVMKDGRGGAVWHGINWGIASEIYFEHFVEMDCDFSHDPVYIAQGIKKLKDGFDLVLGSRYPDGKIINWPFKRRILSLFANLLCRLLISYKIHDYTNGYRFYNRKSALYLSNYKMQCKGYINLSETLCKLLKNNFSISSFPIIFVNREYGSSNTNITETLDALLSIFKIALRYRFDKNF